MEKYLFNFEIRAVGTIKIDSNLDILMSTVSDLVERSQIKILDEGHNNYELEMYFIDYIKLRKFIKFNRVNWLLLNDFRGGGYIASEVALSNNRDRILPLDVKYNFEGFNYVKIKLKENISILIPEDFGVTSYNIYITKDETFKNAQEFNINNWLDSTKEKDNYTILSMILYLRLFKDYASTEVNLWRNFKLKYYDENKNLYKNYR